MYSEISFPSLGITINPPAYFHLGPLTIHMYGIIIATGLILAVLYCSKRAPSFGMTEDDILDGVLTITPFAILCARAYYCAFEWQQYASNPISVLYIWNGGIAIYGSVIGAAIGIFVYSRVKKIRVFTVLDITSLGFLIGQFIGRWGNFFNREAFGGETASFFRMGLYNTITGVTEYHHPTFLYESIWNMCGFFLLHQLSKKRKYDGQVVLGYVAWYGFGRFFIEGLRTDSLYIGAFRISQLVGGISCILAVAALVLLHFRNHKKLYVLEKQEQEATRHE